MCIALAIALHTWEVSPLEVSARIKFIFSAHMNAMELKLWGLRRCVCSMSRQDFGQLFLNHIFWHSKVTILYLGAEGRGGLVKKR